MKNFKRVLNCTPHDLVVYNNDSERKVIVVIPPSGILPRVAQKTVRNEELFIEELGIVIPGSENTYGEVEGMPELKEGDLCVVSAMVRDLLKGSDSIVAPNEQVRNDEGKIIGCLSLAPKQK